MLAKEIVTLVKHILKKLYDSIKTIWAEKPDRYYEIDGFRLDMGEGHMLSLIQKRCLMYDRFVPYLGKLADAKARDSLAHEEPFWIIDIGANVGDTVAAFIRHTKAEILCVEPTKTFIELLEKNIDSMKPYSEQVYIVNAYISNDETESYRSNVVHGTAIKQKVDGAFVQEAPTLTIPSLLKQQNVVPEGIALVKIDTDGYDSECILSFGYMLSEISPLLFWENQIDTKSQLDQFIRMINYMAGHGYEHFFVFDNFGNYLCCVDAYNMKNINRYLGRILYKHSPVSFYYVDVLACKEGDKIMVEKTVEEYAAKFAY